MPALVGILIQNFLFQTNTTEYVLPLLNFRVLFKILIIFTIKRSVSLQMLILEHKKRREQEGGNGSTEMSRLPEGTIAT